MGDNTIDNDKGLEISEILQDHDDACHDGDPIEAHPRCPWCNPSLGGLYGHL